MQVLRHRRGIVKTAKAIVTEEGYAGLWRGNVANLLRIAPFKVCPFGERRGPHLPLPQYSGVWQSRS